MTRSEVVSLAVGLGTAAVAFLLFYLGGVDVSSRNPGLGLAATMSILAGLGAARYSLT